jgi:hypothetical protein
LSGVVGVVHDHVEDGGMSMYTNTLQDDQHYEDNDDGVSRWHSMRIEERWETLGPDGKRVHSAASREDVIADHLRSNEAFSYHVGFMLERGETVENHSTPLCGVRRVLRYITGSHWEVVTDSEQLDARTAG